MSMKRRKTLIAVAGIVVSFICLAGTIVLLSEGEMITVEMAKLMLVALLAMYVGFGFLFAVYRLIDRLK